MKGQKIILFFYPGDLTPNCTLQACNLRDHDADLSKAGFIVAGISPDDSKSHQKFDLKYSLTFPLLMDEEHRIAELYGVWGEKMMFGRKYFGIIRTTFVLNEKLEIMLIIDKPDVKNHAQQILGMLK